MHSETDTYQGFSGHFSPALHPVYFLLHLRFQRGGVTQDSRPMEVRDVALINSFLLAHSELHQIEIVPDIPSPRKLLVLPNEPQQACNIALLPTSNNVASGMSIGQNLAENLNQWVWSPSIARSAFPFCSRCGSPSSTVCDCKSKYQSYAKKMCGNINNQADNQISPTCRSNQCLLHKRQLFGK